MGTTHKKDHPAWARPGDDLLTRQEARQAEAAVVLADLDLFPVLRTVGRPIQTGSLAYGLMVGRDIDVTCLCPALDPASLFEVMGSFAGHPSVYRMAFRNDSGRWNTDPRYPDGLYWTVRYRTEAGGDWNLDLWFLREGTTQFDLEHVETLPPRLTRDTRIAILRIKEAWHGLSAYGTAVHGHDIYEAVLDHDVRTAEEFASYLRRQRQRT